MPLSSLTSLNSENMIEIYSSDNNGIYYSENSNITFTNQDIKTNSCNKIVTTDNANLNMPWYYEINFKGVVATATATTAANVGVVMTENGTEKANTKSVGYSSASSELVPVSFSTIVRVGASCRVVSNAKAIMVKIIGANGYLYNANLTIKMV